MSREIGFGIIGTGLIAPFHLNALKAVKGGGAIGVFDVAQARAKSIANDFGIRVYASLEQMLEDDRIDVICVATPNHLHRDIVIEAAKAGKHVLTEKPPAMSLAETDDMIEVCDKAKVKFGCFVQCRIRKAIQTIKQAIDTGRFGKLLHVDTYMKWFRPAEYYSSDPWRGSRRSGSGVTVAQGFHYIDLLQYLAGPAVRVEAKMANINHPHVKLEDETIAHIDYANGAKGVVQLSTALWPGTDVRIEINGTEGTAVMVGETIDTWKFRDQRPEDENICNIGNAAQATGAGGAADLGFSDHQVVIQDMIEAINEDKDVVIPVKSVRPSLEIVLAMYQSAAGNAPVEWPIQDDESIWDI